MRTFSSILIFIFTLFASEIPAQCPAYEDQIAEISAEVTLRQNRIQAVNALLLDNPENANQMAQELEKQHLQGLFRASKKLKVAADNCQSPEAAGYARQIELLIVKGQKRHFKAIKYCKRIGLSPSGKDMEKLQGKAKKQVNKLLDLLEKIQQNIVWAREDLQDSNPI